MPIFGAQIFIQFNPKEEIIFDEYFYLDQNIKNKEKLVT
jgi:hypothetical protein